MIAACRPRLQRGRAFWGAEMDGMENVPGTPHRASTGPRLLGRGDTYEQLEADHAPDASTGPRLLGRGDALPHPAREGVDPASTGPRLLGRGDLCFCCLLATPHQCFNGAAPFGARRSSGAAGLTPEAPASTGPRLLGRGDTMQGMRSSSSEIGFNGAAPFGARRFQSS